MVAMLLAALSSSGCGGGSGSASATRDRGLLRVEIETSPLSLDPRFGTDAISARVAELIFDSLVKLDGHANFVGDLARSIERPSPTELVFRLHSDVRFSNGQPLTARDVKYTYDSILDPASRSPKRAGFEPLAAIDAPDDYTVRMTTRRPYAPALELALLSVVPRGTPATSGALSTPIGSGPFRLASFGRDEAVVLERNRFHPAPAAAARAIVFKIVPDATVRALELAKGSADFAENNIQPDLLHYLASRPHLSVGRFPGTAYQYLEFNFRIPPLHDLRVRRAIAMAIDRRAIAASVLGDTARVATGMLAPESWAYESGVRTYSYNPAEAEKLLDEAGYPDPGKGKPRLTLHYKTTPEGRRLAEIFQAMLKRVGIELVVRSHEWATYYSDIQRGNFDLTSLQWVGINDPHHYYMVFDSAMTPPHGLNRGAYANPEMDKLVEAGDTALDRKKRREIYSAVQKLAADDLPYLSLWWLDNVVVMKNGLEGFTPYPNGSLISLANLTIGLAPMAGDQQ